MEDDLCLDRDMVKRSVHHGRIRKEGCLFVLSYALMVFEWEINYSSKRMRHTIDERDTLRN